MSWFRKQPDPDPAPDDVVFGLIARRYDDDFSQAMSLGAFDIRFMSSDLSHNAIILILASALERAAGTYLDGDDCRMDEDTAQAFRAVMGAPAAAMRHAQTEAFLKGDNQ